MAESNNKGAAAGGLRQGIRIPLTAWLRLLSGEPWREVRAQFSTWPASLLAESDRIIGGGRATILGPEHGGSFALETLLLRLEWLRQMLVKLRAIGQGPRRPHLGICPETFAIALRAPGVWGATLWTSRLVVLWTGKGAPRPSTTSSAAMIPRARAAGSGVRGRCLPRATVKEFDATKPWEFHFLPAEPAEPFPAKGTAVRFALDESRQPSPDFIEARIDVAFRDVWTISVEDPRVSEAAIRTMLRSDQGRPSIVVQAISEVGMAEDLFAAGTLWLSSLVAEPGSIEGAVRLREALCSASADGRLLAAAESSGPCYYGTEGAPERRLPEELVERALGLGRRLCAAESAPEQADELMADEASNVYGELLAEVAALAVDARNRLFGFSPADAEVRAVLEAAFRAS